MTTISFTTNITGTPDAEDRRAMVMIINDENARRTEFNAQATLFNNTVPPPATPRALLTLLPLSTAAERRTSYEIVLAMRVAEVHENYIRQASERVENDVAFKDLRPLWADATPAKKAAAIAALS